MGIMSKFRRLLAGNLVPWMNAKADALIEGSANQSRLINDKTIKIIQGVDNQTELLNRKLEALIQASENQSRLLDRRLEAIVQGLDNQSRLLNDKLTAIVAAISDPVGQRPASALNMASASISGARTAPVEEKVSGSTKRGTALIAEKTYDTSHPNYDVAIVRNCPGRIFNDTLPCSNKAFLALKQLATGTDVPDAAWAPVLEGALAEIKTIPHAKLVLQRRDALEQYVTELGSRYQARYLPGWVNLDDALFLYWLVRRLNPKTIVQCGVVNGLSSAFITLALAKNGNEGHLYAIDIPPVFNPKDPTWTIPGKTYGMVVPEGKTSGWMVPEAYRKRFEVQNGDSKQLLPRLVDRLPSIDMFYHHSGQTYSDMTFEFHQLRRNLAPGGLVIADDIAGNAALRNFADDNHVPAYNFKGAVGVTFF